MAKKILFILFLSISMIGFSQEKSIHKLTASPNPFTVSTKISFETNANEDVTLVVKNVLGKLAFKKIYKTKKGKNNITFFKNDLKSGIYIYRIKNSKTIISKRLVIK